MVEMLQDKIAADRIIGRQMVQLAELRRSLAETTAALEAARRDIEVARSRRVTIKRLVGLA
jgi:hypothetical protein